jgi:hypothetical protein
LKDKKRRQHAAESILNRSYGKPKETIHVDLDTPPILIMPDSLFKAREAMRGISSDSGVPPAGVTFSPVTFSASSKPPPHTKQEIRSLPAAGQFHRLVPRER